MLVEMNYAEFAGLYGDFINDMMPKVKTITSSYMGMVYHTQVVESAGKRTKWRVKDLMNDIWTKENIQNIIENRIENS